MQYSHIAESHFLRDRFKHIVAIVVDTSNSTKESDLKKPSKKHAGESRI